MNTYKKSIHIWITLTSFAGFLAGWIFLAQAGRQQAVKQNAIDSISAQVLASLPPIQTVDNMVHTLPSNSNLAQAYRVDPATPTPLPQPTPLPTPLPQLSFFKPRIKTSGS